MRTLSAWLVLVLGCSSNGSTSDDAGVTTDPSGGNSGMSASTGTDETGMDESSMDETSDSGFRLDLGQPDLPSPQCWYEDLTMEEAHAWPDCMLAPSDPNSFPMFIEVCVELPESGACADICPPDELCEGMESCDHWGTWFQMCGPNQTEDSCCLLLEIPGPITTD